nr:rod shape-determining protein MreC [Caulobacteraceae bacterium]
MSLRDGPLGEIKPPILWMTGVVLVVSALAAAALLIGDRRETARSRAYAATRGAAESVAAPVGSVLEVPIRWIDGGLGLARDYVMAGSQNRGLRRQLAGALAWRDEALALRLENARLRALAGVRTRPAMPMVLAWTVIDARGPFSNSRLADAGTARGVSEGNPVLGEHGLVGRVTGVAADVSRIMLLTDAESRTPVLIARTNGRAILTGDGGPNPALAYLRTHDPLREGDRVLTSGDGGVIPRGLPVGAAVKGANGAWRVALDADASPIDFVQILLFKDFAQLAPPEALEPLALPSTATEAPEAGAAAPG